MKTTIALALALLASPLLADSVKSTTRTVTKVADGVYMIRHPDAPDGFPQGNTTIVIGDREALVVDSCYLPSAAREDIATVKELTNKPVRYLVNTHWHTDHNSGNGEYLAAFPQLTVVAHQETRKQMEGYYPWWFGNYPKRTATSRELLASGKEADGKPLTDARKESLAQTIERRSKVEPDLAAVKPTFPTFTFESELHFDLGQRKVELRFLGRGNTAGDAVVFLPKERIVATGDLLDHPIPYLGGGYPTELPATLDRLAALGVETIIPGHGELLRGDAARAHVNNVSTFVREVVAQVSKEVYALGNGSRNLDAVRENVLKNIDVAGWRKKFAGADEDNIAFFDSFSLPGLIIAAYAETWRR